MEEKTIKISNGKEFIVRELKYKEMVANAELPKEEVAKFLLQKSSGITNEEYEELSMKDGLIIQRAVNEINGLTTDFLQ